MNNATETTDLLTAVHEIRDLLRLIAEPQIAARDEKQRTELLRIVGRSGPKKQSVLLMDGSRSQADICAQSGIAKGNLSVLVKQLREADLVRGEAKNPILTISIPPNFFDAA
jgi:hypothetical protein